MARKLNKNLVGIMIIASMVLIIVAGMFVISNLPGQDPAKYAADAEKFRTEGDFERATQSYVRAFAKSGNEETLYLVKAAECAMEDGNIGKAREYVNAARVKDATFGPAIDIALKIEVQIARLVDNANQWKRVLEVAEQLVAGDAGRESAFAHHALGQAYIKLRDEDSTFAATGEQALRRANEIDPADVDIVESLTRQIWQQAKAAELRSDDAKAQELRKSRDAIIAVALEKSADNADKSLQLRQLRAQYMIEDGRVNDGLAELEELASTSTSDTGPHRLLGEYYYGRPDLGIERDLDKAVRFLNKGLEVNPKAGMLYIALGSIYKLKRSLAEGDRAVADAALKAERDLYLSGLDTIARGENLLRDWRNNQARVLFIQELFMQDLSEARQQTDSQKRSAQLADSEKWIVQLKGERNEESPEVKFLQAHLLYARGDLVGATSEAETAMRLAGSRAGAPMQRLLTDLYIKQGQWGAAESTLKSLLASAPAEEPLYVAMGQVLLEQQKPNEALRYLRLSDDLSELRLIKPEVAAKMRDSLLNRNETAISLQIEAYRQNNQHDFINALVEKLNKGTPEDALRKANVLVWQEQFGEAEKMIRDVLASDPRSLPAIRSLIFCLQKADRVPEARQFVDGLLRDDPDNRLYKQFALMLLDEGDMQQRDERVLEFIKEEPDELTRYVSLAGYYDARGDLEKVREYLDMAERVSPDSDVVVENQLSLSLRLKDWQRAETYVLRHGELNIDGSRGKMAQGRLALVKAEHLRSENRDQEADDLVNQAIDVMKLGLEAYPNNSRGWTFLAQAYLTVKRMSDARETLRRALQIDPTNAHAHRAMAGLALESGEEDLAMTHLAAAEKDLPQDAWIKSQLQRMRERDDPAKGIESREKRRAEEPEDIENLVLLARLYADAKIKRYSDAESAYREALRLSGNELALAREFTQFLGSPEVNRAPEADRLLQDMLVAEDDLPKKALIAASLGQFYEQQNVLATADRHYAMAVSFDASKDILTLAAEFFTRTRRYEKAIDMFKRVEEIAASDNRTLQQARSRIIAVMLASGRLDEARGRLDQFLELYGDDPQGLIFEGAYHRIGGDIDKAEQAFNARLVKEPENAVALWQRGQVYMLRGRWLQAIEDLKKARNIMPDAFDYQHRIALADAMIEAGRHEDALSELRMILDERPEQHAVAEAMISACTRAARYGDAEALIYQYMRRNPRDYRWPMLLGNLGKLVNDSTKAITGYEQAAQLGQFQPSLLTELFLEYKKANLPQKIIQCASEQLSPAVLKRAPIALSSLAWAYHVGGDKDRAYGAFNAALQAAGENFTAYTRVIAEMVQTVGAQDALTYARAQSEADPENLDKMRALVHLLKMNDRTDESLATCDRMGSLATRDADIIFVNLARGMLLNSVGRYDEAREAYEKALKVDPNQPMVLNNLAYLLGEQLRRPAEAIPYSRQAVRLVSDNPDFLDTLGWLLYQNKQLGEARGMLLRALDHDRHNVAALYHLGIIYKESRNAEDARLRLEQAHERAIKTKDPNQLLPKIEQALKELNEAGGE